MISVRNFRADRGPMHFGEFFCLSNGIELKHFVAPRRYVQAEHFHDDRYQLSFTVQGSTENRVRGQLVTSPAQTFLVARPGDVHTSYGATDALWSQIHVDLPISTVDAWRARLLNDRGSWSLPNPQEVLRSKKLARILPTMLHALAERSDFVLVEELVEELAGEFLALYGASPRDLERRRCRAEAARAAEFMRQCFREPLSLGRLAAVSGLSAFYSTRVFREAHGLPPHAFLRQLRINEAQRLLKDGESIANAAVSVGFFDQAHFSHAFKRLCGLTPREYCRRTRR